MLFRYLKQAFIAASLLTAMVYGQGLNCETVWSGPSADNDVAGCITSTSRAQNNFQSFVPVAVVVLILILFILIFPIMCLWCTCCKCCCDCCKDVPQGERETSKKSRLKVVVVIAIGLIMSIASLGVMLGGAPKVASGATGIFDNLQEHILDFFEHTIQTMVNIVKDPVTGELTAPFTNDTIDTALGFIYDIGNSTMTMRSDVTTNADLITKVGYGVAVVPLLLIAITVLLSCCNCRFCLPTCCSCFYFLCFFIFSLVALVLFIIAPLVGTLAAEVDLQNDKKPGIFQWYVIPFCEAQANFTALIEQVNEMEFELATKMCEEMANYCSPAYDYDIAEPESVFYCDMTNATRATDCPTFQKAVRVLNNTHTKVGATPCGVANCSFRECIDDCTDSQMRDTAEEAIENIDKAARLFKALDYVQPLMDCNVLADRMLMMLKSMPEVRDGLWLIGSGFFIGQIMLLLGIVVMLLGAKLWFSQKEYDEDLADYTEDGPVKEVEMKEVS